MTPLTICCCCVMEYVIDGSDWSLQSQAILLFHSASVCFGKVSFLTPSIFARGTRCSPTHTSFVSLITTSSPNPPHSYCLSSSVFNPPTPADFLCAAVLVDWCDVPASSLSVKLIISEVRHCTMGNQMFFEWWGRWTSSRQESVRVFILKVLQWVSWGENLINPDRLEYLSQL